MIGVKPWMRFRDLWPIVTGSAARDDVKLSGQWALDGDVPIWLSRSSWGMAALAAAFEATAGREPEIWLPEYFCEQALWPLRRRNSKLHFYPVDDRAWPDWDRIRTGGGAPDIFYLTHFFGHANDLTGARSFCDEAGALLVEDSTQTLGPAGQLGAKGDVVFYSPWKFFQTPNGALMLIRPSAAKWLEAVRKAVAELGSGVSPGLQWLKESALASVPGASGPSKPCEDGDFFLDPDITSMPIRPKPSPVAKPILASVCLQETGRRRRENDAALREFFRDVPGWQPFDPAPAEGPMRSVFRLDTPERADAAHTALRRVGVQAEGWPGLPPEVSDPKSNGVILRRTLLNLPCHQDLTPRQLVAAMEKAGLGT